MVAFPRFSSLSSLVAPAGAVVAGGCVALAFATMPVAMLEEWAWRSGLPAIVAAAAPPLGTTARAVLAIGGGALTAAVAWSVLYLLFGTDGLLAPARTLDAVPAIRRGDAHPDAPPRRPMTAAEMGTPLMDVAAPVQRPAPEWTLPADLDQPMSAFDPAAIPDVPLPPPAKVAPMPRAPLAPGERIDTYALPRPATTVAPPPPRPRREATAPALSRPSIDALLARLEAHAAQRLGGMTRAAE